MPNTYDALVPEVWAAEVVLARNANRRVFQTVTQPLESEFSEGDTIHFPVYSNFTTGDAADNGTENAVSSRSFSTVDLLINTHKYVAAHYTKKELKQIAKNARYEQNEQRLMGEALSKKLELDILTAMIAGAGSTINFASGITKAELARLTRIYDALEVPQEDRFLVVDAYGKEDILSIDSLTKVNEAGKVGEALLSRGEVGPGFLGNYFGWNVILSPIVPTSAGSPSKQQAIAYTTGSFGTAVQQGVDLSMDYRTLKIGMDVLADTLYGNKVLRATEITVVTLN